MSQGEVLNCLEKAGKPLSRSEIAERLGANPTHVSITIAKLLKFNEVKAIELDKDEAKEKYNVTRRMCIYIAVQF